MRREMMKWDWNMRYEIRNMRYEMVRYEIRNIWDMTYEICGVIRCAMWDIKYQIWHELWYMRWWDMRLDEKWNEIRKFLKVTWQHPSIHKFLSSFMFLNLVYMLICIFLMFYKKNFLLYVLISFTSKNKFHTLKFLCTKLVFDKLLNYFSIFFLLLFVFMFLFLS